MPAVSQEDSDRMAAYETDARDIFINGTTVGTPLLPAQFTAAEYDGSPVDDRFKQFMRATALALFRIFKNGPMKFPTQTPSYTVAGVPTASANTGCLIFVTNESGGAVPAFSDGTNWRRVTDRAVIS